MVREAMEHGEITQDGYAGVWEECFKQVLYLPTQNKYTRASMAYSKDKVESLERRLLDNRSIMTKEAKNAAKIEKKVSQIRHLIFPILLTAIIVLRLRYC